MKYNKLSCCILSLLLNTAAVLLFCSCNKSPMLAMASEDSDVTQKKKTYRPMIVISDIYETFTPKKAAENSEGSDTTPNKENRLIENNDVTKGIAKGKNSENSETDRSINSNGGLGGAAVILVQEKLRQCQDKERSLSVDLKFAKKDLQSEKENSEKCLTSLHECETKRHKCETERKLSEEMLSFCENRYETCVERSEELGRNSTTIQGHFESQITNLESQIAGLEKNHTEYITTLNKSQGNKTSTITAQKDNLITLLENTKHQAESLQEQYGKCVKRDHTETIRDLNKEITTLAAHKDDLATQLAVKKNETTAFAILNDDLKNQLAFQKNQTESLQKSFVILQQSSRKSNHMQATVGGGGFLLGAVCAGGFVWKKMLNNFNREKDAAEAKATEVARDKDVVIKGQLRTIESLNCIISEKSANTEAYKLLFQKEPQDLVEEESRSNKSKVSRRSRK